MLSDSVIVFRFLPKTLWCQEIPNWSKEQVEFPREMLEHENSYLHDVNPVGDRHFPVAIFVHEVLFQKWFNCQIFSPIVYLSTSTFRNWWSWWSQWVLIAVWHCYLSIKVVCLFCLFVTFRSPKTPVPIAAGTVTKSLMSRVAPRWFHNVWTNGAGVMEYLTILSLKAIKSETNWGVLLGLLESSQWVGFYWGDLKTFRPKTLEILNFE